MCINYDKQASAFKQPISLMEDIQSAAAGMGFERMEEFDYQREHSGSCATDKSCSQNQNFRQQLIEYDFSFNVFYHRKRPENDKESNQNQKTQNSKPNKQDPQNQRTVLSQKFETVTLHIPLKYRESRGLLEIIDDINDSYTEPSSSEDSSDSESSQYKLKQNILYSLTLQEMLFNQSLIKEEQKFLKKLKREYQRKITKMHRVQSTVSIQQAQIDQESLVSLYESEYLSDGLIQGDLNSSTESITQQERVIKQQNNKSFTQLEPPTRPEEYLFINQNDEHQQMNMLGFFGQSVFLLGAGTMAAANAAQNKSKFLRKNSRDILIENQSLFITEVLPEDESIIEQQHKYQGEFQNNNQSLILSETSESLKQSEYISQIQLQKQNVDQCNSILISAESINNINQAVSDSQSFSNSNLINNIQQQNDNLQSYQIGQSNFNSSQNQNFFYQENLNQQDISVLKLYKRFAFKCMNIMINCNIILYGKKDFLVNEMNDDLKI